jgi:hypothetical protein
MKNQQPSNSSNQLNGDKGTPSDKIKSNIFKKMGYTLEYQEQEVNEFDEDEIDFEAGWFWVDNCGERTEDVFECEEDAIDDCLGCVDLFVECSGVDLTKKEKKHIFDLYKVVF